MNSQFIQNAVHMLQQEIAAETSIRLEPDESRLKDLASLLHSFDISDTRKQLILGCCILLQLGVLRHRELAIDDSKALTRSILDGDYFFGLFYRLMMRYKERQLLMLLSPILKKIQIRTVNGQSAERLTEELIEGIRQFLHKLCRPGGGSDEAA